MEKMRGAGAGAGAGATPFVTCELRGGLGNQLFEMYTTIAASMHLHMPFKLYNDERLGDRGTYWRTLFHRFNPLFLISRHQAGHAQRVREPSYHHTPLPVLLQSVDTSRSVLLDGYFQSAKYFESVAPTISRMLQIDVQRDQVNEKLKRVLGAEWNGETTISVHFRLGDYKRLPNHHPMLTKEYYRAALQWIATAGTGDTIQTVLYFCEDDDIAFVEEEYIAHLKSACPSWKWVRCAGKGGEVFADWEEMLAMSCCKHHVIANSTFSWWGAFFNPRTTMQSATTEQSRSYVCYPSRWFGPAMQQHDLKDLFPASWTRIDCGENGTLGLQIPAATASTRSVA